MRVPLDDPAVRDAILTAKLVMRSALGLAYHDHEVAGQPIRAWLDRDFDIGLDFGNVVLVVQPGAVLEMRRRGYFDECAAYTLGGRKLGSFREPLGDPALN